jgi:hypothetical protein
MATHLQIAEWLEGEPAGGNDATPTPRDTLRPPPEPVSPEDGFAALKRRPALVTARELIADKDRPPPLPTAVPELDRLLEGGLVPGHLVELVGRSSSGRFSLVLALLAAATQAGEVAALVDLGDGLDPAGAAAAGIDLPRLLWLRPRRLREALAGAEMLVTTGFPLVVVDLGLPPVPSGRAGALRGGSVQPFWLRLARAARSHGAALLVSAPYRASGAAAAEVVATRSEPLYRGGLRGGRGGSPLLLLGLDTRLSLEKARRRPPGATETLRQHLAA